MQWKIDSPDRRQSLGNAGGLHWPAERLDDRLEAIEACCLADALKAARKNSNLDIILINHRPAGIGGISDIARLRAIAPAVPVVAVSISDDRDEIPRCVVAGAAGAIPKSADREETLKVVKLVLAGDVALPRWILDQPVKSKVHEIPALDGAAPTQGIIVTFTKRQHQIFEHLCNRLTKAEIARELGISISTVRVRIYGIRQRLNLTDRGELERYAVEWRKQTNCVVASNRGGRLTADPRPVRTNNGALYRTLKRTLASCDGSRFP